MKDIILERANFYRNLIKHSVINENYQQAYEAQLILKELEILNNNQITIDFDLESFIEENFYSSKQVAKIIRKSHATVIRQVQKHKLKGFMIGRDYFFVKGYIDNEIVKR